MVVLSRFPYPLEKGDKLRAYHQIKSLSTDFSIHLICTSEKQVSKHDLEKLASFCAEIHVYPLKKWQIPFFSLFYFLIGKPIQVGYFYQRWIHKNIQKQLHKIQPDYVYCQLVRTAEYVKNYHNCPKTIDYMDVLSKGMERRSELSSFFFSWIYRIESNRLRIYERSIFSYFEQHTIISDQDRKWISHPERLKINLIFNGVSERFFDELKLEKEYDLVFTGNMNYPPNIEAAKFIASEIFPPLKAKYPTITCLISGANPAESVQKLAGNGITIGGWIDDIRESYAKSRVFLAPMMLGTGLQNKLLEAMAMGLPCITSSLANNALLAEPTIEICIANTANEYIETIEKLLKNEPFATEIGLNGKKYISKTFRWEKQNELLVRIIQNKGKTN